MGKVGSVVCKTIAPLACLVNPAVGVVLSSTVAIANLVRVKHDRNKKLAIIEKDLNFQKSSAIEASEKDLDLYLDEIRKIYNQNYNYLVENKLVMEEYCLTIKNELLQEKIIIDNLPEVLDLLACFAKDYDLEILDRLNKFREQITILLHWGILHISILSAEEQSYRSILDLTSQTVDCLELDNLGHSALEYAYLIKDCKLIQDLQNSYKLFATNKKIKLAEKLLYDRKLICNQINFEPDLLNCINKQDYILAEALIILEKIPIDPNEINILINLLIAADQHELLEKLLTVRSKCITIELINALQMQYPEPRSYSKEYSFTQIKNYFWLFKNQFLNLEQLHPITNETALEFAVTKGSIQEVINLMIGKASPEQFNHYGENLLMFAIRHQKKSIVDYLINQRKMDLLSFNLQGVNALMMLQARSSNFQEIINQINLNNHLSLRTTDFLRKAAEHYNLWLQRKITTSQARTHIVLGLYILGIRDLMPWNEQELIWLSSKLDLRIQFSPTNAKYNYSSKNLQVIIVNKTINGYTARWRDNFLEVVEPNLQYIDPYDYDFFFKPENSYNNISNYINNNYIIQQKILFLGNNNKKFNLERWLSNSYDPIFRIDELPDGLLIHPEKLSNPKYGFNYYYNMPIIDAGYQALGISRITAAKLLLNYLSDPEILHCIKVEWVNWLIAFKRLPLKLSNIPEIVAKFNDYILSKQEYEKDYNNSENLNKLQIKMANLYDLCNINYCKQYISKVIAIPCNYLNSLKYYPPIKYLNAGGALVALAKISKININIWREINDLECEFSYKLLNPRYTIDILQQSKIMYELSNIAILFKDDQAKIKTVVTHPDLFSSLDKNSDLGAILHGWSDFFSKFAGIIPQNDLLALLIQVKNKLIRNKDLNTEELLQEIKKYRYEFSVELSELFKAQLESNNLIQHNWVQMADARVRELARTMLLQSHCDLIDNYKNNLEFLKSKFQSELEYKLIVLQQQYDLILDNFEKKLSELNNWHENTQTQALMQHESYKLEINQRFNHELAMQSNLLKQQYKKTYKKIIVDLFLDWVNIAFPKIKNSIIYDLARELSVGKLRSDFLLSGFKQGYETISKKFFNELNLVQKALASTIQGISEKLIISLFENAQPKNLLRDLAIAGLESIYNFGIKNHIKFSNNYIQSVLYGSIEGVLDLIKNHKFSVENVFSKISGQLIDEIKPHKNLNLSLFTQNLTKNLANRINANMENNFENNIHFLWKSNLLNKIKKLQDQAKHKFIFDKYNLITSYNNLPKKSLALNLDTINNYIDGLNLATSQQLITHVKKLDPKLDHNNWKNKFIMAVLNSELSCIYELNGDYFIAGISSPKLNSQKLKI